MIYLNALGWQHTLARQLTATVADHDRLQSDLAGFCRPTCSGPCPAHFAGLDRSYLDLRTSICAMNWGNADQERVAF